MSKDDLRAVAVTAGWSESQADEAMKVVTRSGLGHYDHSGRRWRPSSRLPAGGWNRRN